MVLVIRRLRRDERGVASTVGTIMALLVFLTFLSLIVNQYVPVWMKDSEAGHMNTALGQFGNLKGAIDLQILGAQMAQNAGTYFLPTTTSVAVTLGVDGFPIFAAPTFGALSLSPDDGLWSVSFSYLLNGVTMQQSQTASGAMDLNIGNRYNMPQRVAYENGAVIRSQQDGQVVRTPNLFIVQKSGSNLTLAFELVSLYGTGGRTGTATEVVNVKVLGTNVQVYKDVTSPVKIRHVSLYDLAWFNFMNTTLASGFGLSTDGVPSGPATWQYSYSPQQTYFAWTNYYSIWVNSTAPAEPYTMDLLIQNTLHPIGSFTLQEAFVQVGLAEETSANL
ncbi:MAG TPA: hypothetical protein VIB49_02575 [Thermoplasmata archaeon]|jgi:hypothetical protein